MSQIIALEMHTCMHFPNISIIAAITVLAMLEHVNAVHVHVFCNNDCITALEHFLFKITLPFCYTSENNRYHINVLKIQLDD